MLVEAGRKRVDALGAGDWLRRFNGGWYEVRSVQQYSMATAWRMVLYRGSNGVDVMPPERIVDVACEETD